MTPDFLQTTCSGGKENGYFRTSGGVAYPQRLFARYRKERMYISGCLEPIVNSHSRRPGSGDEVF